MCVMYASTYVMRVRVRVQRVHDVICKCVSKCVCTSVCVYVKMHAGLHVCNTCVQTILCVPQRHPTIQQMAILITACTILVQRCTIK